MSVAMPTPPPPVWDAIPAELAQRPQWLLWKFEPNGDKKPNKVPYYLGGGRRAGKVGSEQDRARLGTLEAARKAYERGGWSGVGFAFLPGDGLVGIDIDGAVDAQTGQPSERCAAIIAACGSFTERSVSGKGVHIYALGHTHTNKSNDIGLEVFCERQYFIVTGDAWPGSPPDVRTIDAAVLRRLHATVDAAKGKGKDAPPPATPSAAARPKPVAAPLALPDLRARVESALAAITPDLGYNDWISVGWALRSAFGEFGFGLWDAWSARGAKYAGSADLQTHWKSFTADKAPDDAVAVIFARAKDAGWKPPRAKLSASARGGSGGDHQAAAAPSGGGKPQRARLLKTNNGVVKDCRENVFYCLRDDGALRGLVRMNEFTKLIEKSRVPSWGGTAGEWEESDSYMLGDELAQRYGLTCKNAKTINEGVAMAARELGYNPVVDLIKSQPWDGTERLDYWIADVLGVEHRPYTALIGRLFIMGMVNRAIAPGCKFDYMLILKGAQGAKKSTVFRTLAWPWFTDNGIRMGEKDSLLAIQLVWIAESSELESANRAETSAVKRELSSTQDMFRPPYGAKMIKADRHAVMGGTTNADTFLRDVTGDRRFWPLEVGEINIELLESMRLQLFAEALHRLQSGDAELRRTWPTPKEERELIFPEQEQFKHTDVWEDHLLKYVSATVNHHGDDPSDPPPAQRGFFSRLELFDKALQIKPDRIDGNRQMEMRIANCMKAIGFKKDREGTGARRRGFTRVVDEAPPPQQQAGDAPADSWPGGDDEPF